MQRFKALVKYLKNCFFVVRNDLVFPSWALFVVYLLVAYRIYCGTRIAPSGFWDDAYFFCVTALVLVSLTLLPPIFRGLSVLIWGALLVVFHITNLFFFTFFQSTVNLDALAMSRHVGGRSIFGGKFVHTERRSVSDYRARFGVARRCDVTFPVQSASRDWPCPFVGRGFAGFFGVCQLV